MLNYIEQVAEVLANCDLIFYSDNCYGQQKNRYGWVKHKFILILPLTKKHIFILIFYVYSFSFSDLYLQCTFMRQ